MPNEVVVSVHSAASPETVYQFLADPERAKLWLGPGADFEATANRPFVVRFPHSAPARGVVTTVIPGRRVEFTWGYEDDAHALPPGASRVTISLEPDGTGTRIELRHTILPTPDAATEHEKGWRHYMAALARAAFKASGRAESAITAYHGAWNASDPGARRDSLNSCWAANGVFRDSQGGAVGRGDLADYIDAARAFAPGITIERAGAVLLTGASVLYPWRLVTASGQTIMTGFNVGELADDGTFASLTGFWSEA